MTSLEYLACPVANVGRQAAKTLDDDQPWETTLEGRAEDLAALNGLDTDGYFKQSDAFRADITTLCIAACIQGWTQSSINGANLTWPDALNLGNLENCNPTGLDAWIFAGVNASTYFAASLMYVPSLRRYRLQADISQRLLAVRSTQ